MSARRIGTFYAVAFVATHAVTTAYRLHGGSWNTFVVANAAESPIALSSR